MFDPLQFTGDFVPPRETRGYGKQLANHTKEFGSMIVNLESPLTYNQYEVRKSAVFRRSPRAAIEMREGGIVAVSLANNHILDCGEAGLRDTIDTLAKNSIETIGAGSTLRESFEPLLIRHGAETLGVMAFFDGVLPKMSELHIATSKHLKLVVEQVRALVADEVTPVVLPHWGIEYTWIPSPRQKLIARELADAGTSLIIGHHPHVIQGMERLSNATVFYSLGNFNIEPTLLLHGGELGAIVVLRDSQVAQSVLPLRIRSQGEIELLNELHDARFQKFFEVLSVFASRDMKKVQWKAMFAEPFFQNHLPSFQRRIHKYGLSEAFSLLTWLGSKNTIEWMVGWMLSKASGSKH